MTIKQLLEKCKAQKTFNFITKDQAQVKINKQTFIVDLSKNTYKTRLENFISELDNVSHHVTQTSKQGREFMDTYYTIWRVYLDYLMARMQ